MSIFQQDVDPMDTQKRPFFWGKPSSLVETWKEVLNVKRKTAVSVDFKKCIVLLFSIFIP